MEQKKWKHAILGFYYDYRKLAAVFCCYGLLGTGLIAGGNALHGSQTQTYSLSEKDKDTATPPKDTDKALAAAETEASGNILTTLDNIRSGAASYSLTENTPGLSRQQDSRQAGESQANSQNAAADEASNKKKKKKEKKSEKKKTIQAFSRSNKTVYNKKSYTKKEISILERIVEAEAGDQSIKGRTMVANVILNRVASKEFPDTIKEVVFQNDGTVYQFSPILDGRYYDVDISAKTKKAVQRVFKTKDQTNGALYFMARKEASKKNVKWFDSSLTKVTSYGCHEFFK